MGTPIADAKGVLYEEEVGYKRSVSESTFLKMGGAINFMNNRLHQTIKFQLNGVYNQIGTPLYYIDGMVIFPYDVEIFNAYMYNMIAGSSGTTELDLRLVTAPRNATTSIFSTTPKITSAAGNVAYVGVGDTVSGCTAPIITTANINEGQGLVFHLLQAQSGSPRSCGIILNFRPR